MISIYDDSYYFLNLETERENFNYVPKKLNKALFQKLQKIEEKKEAEYRERKQAEKLLEQAKGPKGKKSKQLKQDMEKTNLKKTNFVEQERNIHESYQLILNEYYRKVRARRKAMESGAMLFGKVQTDPKKLEKMVVGNSALAEEEEPGNN